MQETIRLIADSDLDRRGFLKGVGIAGVGLLTAGLLAGCGGNGTAGLPSNSDQQILGAAKIAEALATTMYASFNASALFSALVATDQVYFTAALNEEKFHYDLLKSNTGNTDAPLTYFFPAQTFTDLQTTLNVMVTLEEAFIAAYLVGIRSLSTPALKVLAGQIMGVEVAHRALIRATAGDGGLSTVTGLSGTAEPASPPNNEIYQRTFGVSSIDQAVTALKPFFDATAAASAGHTVQKTFNPALAPSASGLVGNPPS